MKPWRLLIESGQHPQLVLGAKQAPSISPPEIKEASPALVLDPDRRAQAWDLLKEARLKERAAIKAGRDEEVEQITTWIGGGIMILATLVSESPEALLAKLKDEVWVAPYVSPEEMSEAERRATFTPVERKRATPPPGAPRPLDLSELTPEEREELGIILPEEQDLGVPLEPESAPVILETASGTTVTVSDPHARGGSRGS